MRRREWVLPLSVVGVQRVSGPAIEHRSAMMIFVKEPSGEILNVCEQLATENDVVLGQRRNAASQRQRSACGCLRVDAHQVQELIQQSNADRTDRRAPPGGTAASPLSARLRKSPGIRSRAVERLTVRSLRSFVRTPPLPPSKPHSPISTRVYMARQV